MLKKWTNSNGNKAETKPKYLKLLLSTVFLALSCSHIAHAKVISCHSSNYGALTVNTGINILQQKDGEVVEMTPRKTAGVYDLRIAEQHVVLLMRGSSSIIISQVDGGAEIEIEELFCGTNGD